jgi:hypothetical protein
MFLFFIFYFLFSPVRAQIGTWRNYLAYYDIQQIRAAGDYIFVLASNGLYQYNQNDQSIVTYDRVNGLSDTNISHIAWCPKAKRLIAVYKNSNIDLIETNGNITNISDLFTKVMTGDKTVSSIRIDGVYAYLICGFGIVKVNVERAEISDSYTPNHPDYPKTLPDEDNSDYEKYYDLVSKLLPGGPKHNYFGFMRFMNGKLYTCGGSYSSPATIQVWDGTNWQLYQDSDISSKTGVAFQGALCLDVQQTAQGDHVFVGAGNGLYEYLRGNFVNYYGYKNSPIERFNGIDAEYQLVTGVKFDTANNLWLLNSQAPTASLIRLTNETFTKFNHSEWMKLNEGGKMKSNGNLVSMFIDSRGLLWFVNDNWVRPAYYRYDMANDIAVAYESFVNQDGTVIQNLYGVKCITEDLENNLWIGTDQGPFMIEKATIVSGEATITQVKVPRNDGTNYADYLLSGINISSIAIDGAGRKWFGTNGNGVYLISADNMTQLQHFTTENSSLLSNTVMAVAINQTTGEVFFGTENGLCSYISDATQTNTEMTSDNVWAYPNPVEPGYTGPITITGLTLNADVKILSSNGAVVNEGHSNGGTFVWYGNDKKGRRVASGIYMVVTATNTGEKGTVCKIAIIN